jgi:hypothetical protein
MIQIDKELAVTQDCTAHFLRLLAQLRETNRPEESPLVASGYRAEVEKMQREVLDYLTQRRTEFIPFPTKGTE